MKSFAFIVVFMLSLSLSHFGCDAAVSFEGRHKSRVVEYDAYPTLVEVDATKVAKASRADVPSISLDLKTVLHTVDPEFLSVTIPAYQIQDNFDLINFSLPRVQNMARGLNPAMLRVGGTSGDDLIFVKASGPQKGAINFTMTTTQWDALNRFVREVGWKFVFGLNGVLRNPWPTGPWDSVNARELLEYTISRGYNVSLELGNEPSIWSNKHGAELKVPPNEHARDFDILHQLLQELNYKPSFVVGPDVCCSATYFTDYYAPSPKRAATDFYNVTILDSFITKATEYVAIQKEYLPDTPIWLGETSSFIQAAEEKYAESYIAGFVWLDKLGVAAITRHTRVFRQDFVMFHYALLTSSQEPTPDYWLSLLYKKLVGTHVLDVTGSLLPGRHLRVYGHCAKSPYPSGSVVLLLLNVNSTSTTAYLTNSELASSTRDVYWLTPPNSNLTSTSVELNGHLLQLVNNVELPEIKALEKPAGSTITLPPISFGFYVFKNVKSVACSL